MLNFLQQFFMSDGLMVVEKGDYLAYGFGLPELANKILYVNDIAPAWDVVKAVATTISSTIGMC